MGSFAYGLRALADLVFWPFDRLGPLFGLTLFSVVTGAVMLWVVGKTTPQRLVERARDRMSASIYEIRLFLDSPRRVLSAQVRLLGWSFLYVGAMLPALLILSLPLGLFYLHGEVRYGLAPLEVGQPVVVTAELRDGVDGYALTAESAGGARVTAMPVYVEEEGRVYFRAVMDEPGLGELTLRAGDRVAKKELRAGEGRASPTRGSGSALFWIETDEAPLPDDSPVRSISLSHPTWDRSWVGMPWWWLYWLLVATIAALALRRPLDVAI